MNNAGSQTSAWHWTAFGFPLNVVATPYFFAVAGATTVIVTSIVTAALLLLWVFSPYAVSAVLTSVLVLAIGFVVAAFTWKKPKWGGTFLVFRNVPPMTEMVLRWRSSRSATDRAVYFRLYPGLVVYSPWYWVVDGDVDMTPILIEQKAKDEVEINAVDGTIMKVDTQITCEVTDAIDFMMYWKNDRGGVAKLVREYLETALQHATSVRKLNKGQGTIQIGDTTVDDWDCTTVGLTDLSKDELAHMGDFVTAHVNQSLGSAGGEQRFGVKTRIKINVLRSRDVIAKAQESAAARELQVKEMLTEFKGITKVMQMIIETCKEQIPEQIKAQVERILARPNLTQDDVQRAAELIKPFLPNLTVLSALMAATPLVRDTLEQVWGGEKRAKGGTGSAPASDSKPAKEGRS